MSIDRRSLLSLIGAGSVATPAFAAPSRTPAVTFLHSVASGDPTTTGAIFWTRVTPADPSGGDVELKLEIARDADFADMVRTSNGLRARAARDFTVKDDLDGQGLGHKRSHRAKSGPKSARRGV